MKNLQIPLSLQEIAKREKEELEKQINEMISNFEKKWKVNYVDMQLLPISSIKNGLPYNQQKGGKIQFFLIL